MACLREHKDELSPACKAKAGEMKEHMKEAREACKGDVQKFCADKKPGGGHIMECLKGHEAELSEGCKAEMAKAPKLKNLHKGEKH